jgi:hypothetical protein
MLGPLASNGGPTQTHALDPGSIALDKGHASGATTDQRGLTRPCDDGSISNAPGGDGGDVGAFERQVSCVTGTRPMRWTTRRRSSRTAARTRSTCLRMTAIRTSIRWRSSP